MSPRVAIPLLIVLVLGGLLIGAAAGVAVITLLTIAGIVLAAVVAAWILRKVSSRNRG